MLVVAGAAQLTALELMQDNTPHSNCYFIGVGFEFAHGALLGLTDTAFGRGKVLAEDGGSVCNG